MFESRKTTCIIIILLVIFLGGIMAPANASAGDTNPEITTSNDIPGLMELMSISPLTELDASPDFNLMSLAEEQINLRQQRGKVVLLSFWATW
jgi:hypothetical protein